MSMRHQFLDSQGRIARSIQGEVVVRAIQAHLGKMDSKGKKDSRFVLNEHGHLVFSRLIGELLYKSDPVEYKAKDKVGLSEILGKEILERDLLNDIHLATKSGTARRAEIRFPTDKEKQRVFLDTIEDTMSYINGNTGVQYSQERMLAACVQILLEHLVNYEEKNGQSLLDEVPSQEDARSFIDRRWNAPASTEGRRLSAGSAGEEESGVYDSVDYARLYHDEVIRRETAEKRLAKAKSLARQILAIGE